MLCLMAILVSGMFVIVSIFIRNVGGGYFEMVLILFVYVLMHRLFYNRVVLQPTVYMCLF